MPVRGGQERKSRGLEAGPHADDPMLLGYGMADCPILTDNDAEWAGGTTWPRILRNLGPEAPGQARLAPDHP